VPFRAFISDTNGHLTGMLFKQREGSPAAAWDFLKSVLIVRLMPNVGIGGVLNQAFLAEP
jgi:hypothetical protein